MDFNRQRRAAKGWPERMKPKPAKVLETNAFATGLDHPRWLYVLPNGDVLVAETNRRPARKLARASRAWLLTFS